jgi:hypothetical protein
LSAAHRTRKPERVRRGSLTRSVPDTDIVRKQFGLSYRLKGRNIQEPNGNLQGAAGQITQIASRPKNRHEISGNEKFPPSQSPSANIGAGCLSGWRSNNWFAENECRRGRRSARLSCGLLDFAGRFFIEKGEYVLKNAQEKTGSPCKEPRQPTGIGWVRWGFGTERY